MSIEDFETVYVTGIDPTESKTRIRIRYKRNEVRELTQSYWTLGCHTQLQLGEGQSDA